MWCCRRLQRRDSDGSLGDSGEGPDGDSGDQQGKKSSRSRSFFSRSLGSNLPSKKKRKHDKEKADNKPEDGDVGDLSVVKRETEVLRSFQRAPPPKNRARASRVPRGLKSQNVTTNNFLQEVVETDQEQETQSTSKQNDTTSTTPGKTEDGSQPNTLVPSDDVDIPKTTSAETEVPRSTEGEESQDNVSSSEKDTVPKSSEAEAVAETATQEPSQPASEEADDSESPQKAENEASDSVKEEDVSVKPDSDDSLTEQAKGDGPCKAEKEESSTKQTKDGGASPKPEHEDSSTKDEASPKSEHEGCSAEQSKTNEASDVGDEGGDKNEGTDTSPEQETKDEQTDICALVEPDTTDASNTTAEEDGDKKIPHRPASYSEYSSSSPKPAAVKGKRFTLPSSHGEGMDQLLETLQTRLKEDGVPVVTTDLELSQNTESSEQKPAEGAQSQSDADQQQDVKVDTGAESPSSRDMPL